MSDLRILVTGAGGFVGSALTSSLISNGAAVKGMLRGGADSSLDHGEGIYFSGNICSPDSYRGALDSMDVVIHLAGLAHVTDRGVDGDSSRYHRVNVEGTEQLARLAASAGVRRFIFVSSISVYDDLFGNQVVVSEDTREQPRSEYGLSKLEAERRLQAVTDESDMDFVIIRPALVVGAGAPGNLARLNRWVQSGMPVPVPSRENRRAYVTRDTLVDVLRACIESDAVSNQKLIVTEGHSPSTRQVVEWMAYGAGKKSLCPRLPASILKLVFRMVGKSSIYEKLLGDLLISGSRAESMFGPYPKGRLELAFNQLGASE